MNSHDCMTLDLKLLHEELDHESVDGRATDGRGVRLDDGGHWTSNGFEAQLDYRPTRDTRLVGAYSYIDLEGDSTSTVDENREPDGYRSIDNGAPRDTLSLLLSHRFARQWMASLGLYYMDEMKWRGAGDDVDSYTWLDFKLAKDFPTGGGGEGQVALIVHDLPGEEYGEFRNPGRSDRPGNVFDRRAHLQFSPQFGRVAGPHRHIGQIAGGR